MTKIPNPAKHTDQRNRLLSHARHLFALQGVKETSMSQVAQTCKITKATLYHYFKSKDALLKEILDCREKRQEELMPPAGNLKECLEQIIRRRLKEMERPENLEIMKIMISETMKNEEMRKVYMEFMKENISFGARSVAAFVTGKKTEKELKLIFFQFMSVLFHYNWYLKVAGDSSGVIGGEETFIHQLVKTYMGAFQAD